MSVFTKKCEISVAARFCDIWLHLCGNLMRLVPPYLSRVFQHRTASVGCPSHKFHPAQISWRFVVIIRGIGSMRTILRSLIRGFISSLRSRAALRLEIIALCHQLDVLQRSQRTRIRLTNLDRNYWVLFYRLWSGCVDDLGSHWLLSLVCRKREPLTAIAFVFVIGHLLSPPLSL